MRKGKIGGHSNYFDNDDLQYIKHQLESKLSKDSKDLMSRNEIHLSPK